VTADPMTDDAFFLPDEAATEALARRLAPLLAPGDRIALSGPVGAGKSTFARALIRALVGDPAAEVPSPTFTLVQTYDARGPAGTVWPVHHFDLYRLTDPSEVEELGWDEALAEGLCLIEWPDRAGALLPAERLDLALATGPDGSGRLARLTGRGAPAAALARKAREAAS
jgi:tRNA threonylcarbamoyladenosine biosynthesis protein TsaE